MPIVVGVSFRKAEKLHFFDPGTEELKPGEAVLAHTSRGLELGEVKLGPAEVAEGELSQPLKAVLRRATAEDLDRHLHNQAREEEALAICRAKIAEHGLPMKLISAERTFDGSRITVHFSAEGRVDFRQLVRDLARTLKCRIELRQVGVRDETKLRGGIGPCGQELCCARFLSSFQPVGIRMAKEQDLSLNPAKISGLCGRLMCCLGYEYENYRELRRGLPRLGATVQTAQGRGKLVELNLLRGTALISLEEGGDLRLSTAELKAFCPEPDQAEQPEPVGEEEEELAETEEQS